MFLNRFLITFFTTKMTSCKDALKNWETKTGEVAVEAVAIKLYAQNPPITKMDASLNSLDNCEHLSLSTNSIDRLIPLPGLKKLRILSVGRNCLKKLEKLDDVAGSLEEIWASYNFISNLDGLHNLTNLEVLYLSNNKIKDCAELGKLAGLSKLRDILLIGNPCYDGMEKADQRRAVLAQLPNIAKIDGEMVTAADREPAAEE